MTGHALLAPSAAERWLACPASVQMASKVVELSGQDDGGVYAVEGTRAHTRAYLQAAYVFGQITAEEYNLQFDAWAKTVEPEQLDDMATYASLYVEVLMEIMEEAGPTGILLLEQRMDTGVPYCWGTSDAVIIGPGWIHIVDYKYGKGVAVSAIKNPQLMLYTLGALDTFDDIGEVLTVSMTIHQPRIGQRSTYTMGADELRQWRKEVAIPIAERALGETPNFGPSLEACRWCPAAGECKPRMLHITRLDFGDPDLLTVEELAEALAKTEEMRNWCAAVDAVGLQKAYSENVAIPGWKVVMSGGRRSIPEVEPAVQVLIDAGYPAEKTVRVGIKPLGELERLVGKKELPKILGDLLVKSPGSPSLVREDDSRPAINPETEAQKDFA